MCSNMVPIALSLKAARSTRRRYSRSESRTPLLKRFWMDYFREAEDVFYSNRKMSMQPWAPTLDQKLCLCSQEQSKNSGLAIILSATNK